MPSLTVLVASARDLKDTERWGKQDPFVRVRVHDKKWRTKTHDDGEDAGEWNEEHIFGLGDENEIIVEVLNDNTLKSDEVIGAARVSLETVRAEGTEKLSKTLYHGDGTPAGTVELTLTFSEEDQPEASKDEEEDDYNAAKIALGVGLAGLAVGAAGYAAYKYANKNDGDEAAEGEAAAAEEAAE